jgi:hypothetical protein
MKASLENFFGLGATMEATFSATELYVCLNQ